MLRKIIHLNRNTIGCRITDELIEFSFPPEDIYIHNIRNNRNLKMVTYLRNHWGVQQIIVNPTTQLDRVLHRDSTLYIYNPHVKDIILSYNILKSNL